MLWDDVVEKAVAYFTEHESVFDDLTKEMVEDGIIVGNGEYHLMEELDEIYNDGRSTLDIMKVALNGSDEYGGDFDLDREYFYYDANEELVSTDDYAPEVNLDDATISTLYEHRDSYELPKVIKKLFAAYDDEGED